LRLALDIEHLPHVVCGQHAALDRHVTETDARAGRAPRRLFGERRVDLVAAGEGAEASVMAGALEGGTAAW